MRRRLPYALFLPWVLLGACAFGRLRPGPTNIGMALAVSAPGINSAQREAVLSTLDLFVARGSLSWNSAVEFVRERYTEFSGRTRVRSGQAVCEVDFSKFISALDAKGFLRPTGVYSHEPRVALFLDEPEVISDLGIGPAADGLRRGLSAYGVAAVDGRSLVADAPLDGAGGLDLREAAERSGAQWVLIAAANVQDEFDTASASWRAQARLQVDAYEVGHSTPAGRALLDSASVDNSSGAARAKALALVGEDIAAQLSTMITRSMKGRSEAAVIVTGECGLPCLRALLSNLRAVEGVAGAFLGTWRGKEGSLILRVFLEDIKVDGLAARLLRRDRTLNLVAIEPEVGRLAIEMSERDEP
ncbi:MAG: hypothetical protein AAB036_10355 [Elusimicrobiota bacterium]